MKTNLMLFLGVILLASCGGGDGDDDKKPAVANLDFTITNGNDGSGNVSVKATAENATYYQVFFDKNSSSEFVPSSNGEASYQYESSGTYTISVTAYSDVTTSISTNKEVTVTVAEKEMTLVWEDQFDGSSVNTDYWSFETGGGGWGNNELESYTTTNHGVADGFLTISARKEENGSYTSTRMITKDKKVFKYGHIDIRAKLPFGQGIWPALWMLGNNIDGGDHAWPKCGEIDIMEMIGGSGTSDNNRTTYGTPHWYESSDVPHASYGGSKKLSGSAIFHDDFHIFSIDWTDKQIVWLLDGVQFHVIDITPANLSEFKADYFLIFNVAVGGNWPGNPDGTTTFPQSMIVDYIKVYQYK